MPPEELAKLIALLASQTSSIDPTLMASAMPSANVSPANIASAMNPNVLLTSGLVDPQTIAAGQETVYQQMLADWEARNNTVLPFEASDAILIPITNKYVGNDEVSQFMQEIMSGIKTGATTAEAIKAKIARDPTSVPKAVFDQYTQIDADLTDFGKAVEKQNEAKVKFAYEQSTSGKALTPPPTYQQARSKFYKDLGVPEMALLPDVMDTYEFDPSLFGDKARTGQLDKLLRIRESEEARKRPLDEYGASLARVSAAKGDLATAKSVGERAREQYLAENAKPDQITQMLDFASRDRILGGLFGKDQTTERKNLAAQAGTKAMEAELARLQAASKVSTETPYSESGRRAAVARQAKIGDEQYQQDVANYVSQKLAAQGITPNRNAINQLLGYATTVAKKK